MTVFEFVEDTDVLPQVKDKIIWNILGSHCWISFNSWNVKWIKIRISEGKRTHLPTKLPTVYHFLKTSCPTWKEFFGEGIGQRHSDVTLEPPCHSTKMEDKLWKSYLYLWYGLILQCLRVILESHNRLFEEKCLDVSRLEKFHFWKRITTWFLFSISITEPARELDALPTHNSLTTISCV